MIAGNVADRSDTPIVMKFGGSSFIDIEGYKQTAAYIADRVVTERRRAVVVVSAMSGTTGRLQETLRTVHTSPPAEVASMLLTTGEVVSVALLTAALIDNDIAARGLAGDEIGMVARGVADRASLRSIEPSRLMAALDGVSVVVLPGGQAVDEDGRLVMLGRNSSDLTAVGAAIAVGADLCELFSDVPGICSADPHLLPDARVLPTVDYGSMLHLSSGGAKVIQSDAVRWAEQHGVRIVCRSLPPAALSETVVGPGPGVAAVALHERGDVWVFSDAQARQRAGDELIAQGLGALPLRGDEQNDQRIDGSALIVTAYGNDDVATRCCEGGTPRPDLCLLTVVEPDGRVERLLVPRSTGIDEARRRHALLHPSSSRLPTVPRQKVRSSMSGLLTGSTG